MVFFLLCLFLVNGLQTNPGGCPSSFQTDGLDIDCCVSFMMPGPYIPDKAVMFHWADVKQTSDKDCGLCFLEFDLSTYRTEFIDRFPQDIVKIRPDWVVKETRLVITPKKENWACSSNHYCVLVMNPKREQMCRRQPVQNTHDGDSNKEQIRIVTSVAENRTGSTFLL